MHGAPFQSSIHTAPAYGRAVNLKSSGNVSAVCASTRREAGHRSRRDLASPPLGL